MTNHLNESAKNVSDEKDIATIIQFALDRGATLATRIAPVSIQIEERLASYCRTPKCPNFGLSMSCPPHLSGPAGFRKLVARSKHAIVIRLEIDSSSLHGEQRNEVMKLLHEITASVELEAQRLGFLKSQGFAAGSCKMSFCSEHQSCRVLEGDGSCRHPESARQSMSGYGVNVGDLMQSAGWSNDLFPPPSSEGEEKLSWVAGLILLL